MEEKLADAIIDNLEKKARGKNLIRGIKRLAAHPNTADVVQIHSRDPKQALSLLKETVGNPERYRGWANALSPGGRGKGGNYLPNLVQMAKDTRKGLSRARSVDASKVRQTQNVASRADAMDKLKGLFN